MRAERREEEEEEEEEDIYIPVQRSVPGQGRVQGKWRRDAVGNKNIFFFSSFVVCNQTKLTAECHVRLHVHTYFCYQSHFWA